MNASSGRSRCRGGVGGNGAEALPALLSRALERRRLWIRRQAVCCAQRISDGAVHLTLCTRSLRRQQLATCASRLERKAGDARAIPQMPGYIIPLRCEPGGRTCVFSKPGRHLQAP